MKLLTRDEFREGVFVRDNHKCVVCFAPAVDAHHIIERRLWPVETQGYYLDNGASLCTIHHLLAERNILCPDVIRRYAHIITNVYPPSFDPDKDYDKWGKELRKANTDNIKYPSTPHLWFSPTIDLDIDDPGGVTTDLSMFVGVDVIPTIKMDGSNVKITRDFVAARNGFDAAHPSFDLLKKQHTEFAYKIPEHLIIFGEWLYAKHSIAYDQLESYLQIFAVFDTQTNLWLSWYEVGELTQQLGLRTVPEGRIIHIDNARELEATIKIIGEQAVALGQEGIVIRLVNAFHYGQFSQCVAKYVRANHVQTNQHWKDQQIIRNKLRTK